MAETLATIDAARNSHNLTSKIGGDDFCSRICAMMPSRKWGAIFAAIALIIVAFGTGAYLSALSYSHGEEQCTKLAISAAYSVKGCPRQIDTNRHGLPYLAESVVSNPEPKDSEEREQRDLAAQESMSVWAFWMMALSAVGMIITSIGTGLLLWQIILTRRAVAETGEATEAMREANRIATDNSHRELRAYLAVNSVTLDESDWDDDRLHLRVELQNAGQTPATLKDVHIKAIWGFSGGDVTLIDHKSKNDVRCHRDTPMHIPFSFKDDAEKLEEVGHLMVFGRIEYLDVFGKLQKEPFSYQTPTGSNFYVAFHGHSLPLRLAAFSPLSILDQIDTEKSKRQSDGDSETE